jgi:hypothetical protein
MLSSEIRSLKPLPVEFYLVPPNTSWSAESMCDDDVDFACIVRAGSAKNAHLAALDGAAERLRLFRADLVDSGSVAAAVAGCDGVFHVACPVPDYTLADPEAPHHFTFSFTRHRVSPCMPSCAISIRGLDSMRTPIHACCCRPSCSLPPWRAP